jgi:hypothetical protein
LGSWIKQLYQEHHRAPPENCWRALVEEYSKRALTKKTDKLPTISGLAKLFMEMPLESYPQNGSSALRPSRKLALGTYEAGLWKRTFIPDLTWCMLKSKSKDSGPIPYRAPSWSWAFVDGPVGFLDRKKFGMSKLKARRRIDCTVDNVNCETILPSDLTGPVKAAHAVLAGSLVAVELFDPIHHKEKSYHFSKLFLAHRSCVRGKNGYEVEVALDKPWQTFKDRVDCFRLFTWVTPKKLFTGDPRWIRPEVWFLVLQKSPRDRTAFERIGASFGSSQDRHPGCDCDLPLFDGAESTSIKIV